MRGNTTLIVVIVAIVVLLGVFWYMRSGSVPTPTTEVPVGTEVPAGEVPAAPEQPTETPATGEVVPQ